MTTGKTAYCLINYSLKNGRSQIFNRCPLIDKGLYICLGEYTASGSDRINHCVLFRSFIKSCSISIEQYSHLIYESTCTACTCSVHTLFDSLPVKCYLSVLTAQFYGNISFRDKCLNSSAAGHHLLLKRDLQYVRKR